MKIFTNSENIKLTGIYAVITAAACAVSVAFGSNPVFVIIPVVVLWFVTMKFSRKRMDNLVNISVELDKLLYDGQGVDFGEFTEGELSVLKSQLEKVVLKLHRRREDLQKEKINLTDSIADISHQLRTPLTSMNLIINFLKNKDLSRERRSRMAMELQRLANRIDWLINALLKISKIDAGTADFHYEKVYVSQLIKKRIAPLEIGMDLKDQSFVMHRQGDEYFTGDIAWTSEAIGNLLKNCSEHTPPGGRVTATVEQTAVYTRIEIRDSGPGFCQRDIPHLFTRFYKGKNAGPDSVGIGLALARMIITNQNGTIKADNHPQGGARFTVKFYHSVV